MPAYIETILHGQPPAGQPCSVCGLLLKAGEQLARCGSDGALHHAECWIWNSNRCGALGCSGAGALVAGPPPIVPAGVAPGTAPTGTRLMLPPLPAPTAPASPAPLQHPTTAMAGIEAALANQ
jgi:hypothetical protein